MESVYYDSDGEEEGEQDEGGQVEQGEKEGMNISDSEDDHQPPLPKKPKLS